MLCILLHRNNSWHDIFQLHEVVNTFFIQTYYTDYFKRSATNTVRQLKEDIRRQEDLTKEAKDQNTREAKR